MRRIHNWTHRGGESSELATHHLSLFKRRWGTFNTFPPDHRKTTVNITKRKRVKWQQKHVDQPPEIHKIPQQVIGASLEEMVRRVLSRPIVVIKDNGLPKSKWKLAAVKQLMECRDGETRGAVLRATTKKWTHTTLRRKSQRLCPLEVNAVRTATENGSSKQRDKITLLSILERRKAAINHFKFRRLLV